MTNNAAYNSVNCKSIQINMNQMEQALQCWRDEKLKYEKSIKAVIAELSVSIKYIPSAEFDNKLEQLKEYLLYSYTYEEEERFLEIYVHYVAGVKNMTLMELSNKLSLQIGGEIKFWQNKIIDVAENVVYHPDLTIWEVNRAFERYMGLSPEVTNNLRKKKSLAKYYLSALTSIIKLIQRSKPFQEDLLKIDESYKKLKKIQQKYYAFLEQTENKRINMIEHNISTKGKDNAKGTLFMFVKSKQEKKVNTLINYNFKTSKEINQKPSKLLKEQKYQEFDQFFKQLRHQYKSQGYSNGGFSECSKSWSDVRSVTKDDSRQSSLNDLREEFKLSFIHQRSQQAATQSKSHNVFIWSKEYYFSYWNFPIVFTQPIDFMDPFHIYDFINYDIDSSDQFDELNAEDVDADDSSSQASSQSVNNSFVVSDNYQSDEEERERERISSAITSYKERWSKDNNLEQYQLICLYQKTPLPLDIDQLQLSNQFLQSMNGKSRNQIFSIFEKDKSHVSKSRIQSLLKNDFKKIKTKQKKIVYIRQSSTDKSKEKNEQNRPIVLDLTEEDQTSDVYEVTISNPTKIKPFCPNQTIIEESYECNSASK